VGIKERTNQQAKKCNCRQKVRTHRVDDWLQKVHSRGGSYERLKGVGRSTRDLASRGKEDL
jgi:hypothetical protein